MGGQPYDHEARDPFTTVEALMPDGRAVLGPFKEHDGLMKSRIGAYKKKYRSAFR